jgi:hypothetical protein
MTVDQILALITALATLAAVFFAWRAAKAAKDSVTVAEKAAVAARDSVTVSEKAATAAAQSVAIAHQARREERAAQRIRQLQMIGEALAAVQGAADTASRSAFPMGVPVGMTAAEAVAMRPEIAVHATYWRSMEQLGLALANVPSEALPKCRQVAREQRKPPGTKDLLPGAFGELTEALKTAWAELKRLEEQTPSSPVA